MPPFEDADFPASPVSVGAKNKHANAPWHRIHKLPGVGSPPQLFTNIAADSISQGELGDCWLLAAISCVADFPGHIMDLFHPKVYNPEGWYEIRLFDIAAGWTTVRIDDRVPVMHWGAPCFAQVHAGGGIWTLLLEKAFAKFCGSYQSLSGGGASWAYQVLTGITEQLSFNRKADGGGRWQFWHVDVGKQKADPAKWRQRGMKTCTLTSRSPVPTYDPQELFGLLAYFDQCQCVMSASINGEVMEKRRPDGLVENHAYAVLQVVKVHDMPLIQLRNPWGRTEWQGRFSDFSDDWKRYPQIARDVGHDTEQDGEFWMPWLDFAAIYSEIKVAPGCLTVPKNQATGGKKKDGVACGYCKKSITRLWIMTDFAVGLHGEWTRMQEGDFCVMCRRAQTGMQRFRGPFQKVPGIDQFYRKPKLTAPEPPRPKPECKFGPSCYRHNPEHFAEYSHPWLGMRFDGKPWCKPAGPVLLGPGAPVHAGKAVAGPKPVAVKSSLAVPEPQGGGGGKARASSPAPPVPPQPDAPLHYSEDGSAPRGSGSSSARHSVVVSSQDLGTVHELLNLAKSGDWRACLALLSQRPELVDARPSGRNWALVHRAAGGNDLAALRRILEELHGDPELLTGDGKTALQVARSGGEKCRDAAAYLARLSSGAEGESGRLLEAAKAGRWADAIAILRVRPAFVNMQQAGQSSVLHLAAQSGNVGLVQLLVEGFDADVDARDGRNCLAADVARSGGHEVVTAYFTMIDGPEAVRMEHFVEAAEERTREDRVREVAAPEASGALAAFDEALLAARNQKWDAMFAAFARSWRGGVNLRPPARHWAALHHAARAGELAVVRRLVEELGAEPGLLAADAATTPADVAARHGRANVANYLVGRR